MISPSAPDYPGDWARCAPGDPPPLGAIQAPDKFTSYVCMWPERDFVLGRGSAGRGIPGMDAWFPHGGEWAASRDKISRFQVLVDDGKIPGLYAWAKISKLHEMLELKPVEVNGLSPVVVNDILGKGSIKYLSAWTSEGGKELGHEKEVVLRSLVLCQRLPKHRADNGWREVHIHEPAKITENQVTTECLEKKVETVVNDTEEVKTMKVVVKYKSQEGQEWKADEQEECSLDTVVKSENVVRKLAEADFTLGRSLYATKLQSIVISDSEVVRSYQVLPKSEMVVKLSVFQQSYKLHCPGMEHIYTKEGKLVLKRLVQGQFRAVTTNEVRVEISERKLRESK